MVVARKQNPFALKEGEILRAMLDRKGVGQTELAKVVNKTENVVSNWVRGVTRMKDAEKAHVAAFFGVPPANLNYDADQLSTLANKDPQAARKITQGFSNKAAIRWWRGALAGSMDEECTFEENGLLEVATYFLVGGYENADRHDVVTPSGLSMFPRINSGDRVIIFNDQTPRQNTIVLAESPDHKVYMKVLRLREGRYVLESINPAYPTMHDLNGWTLHGYAVAIMKGDPDPGQPNIEYLEGAPLRA